MCVHVQYDQESKGCVSFGKLEVATFEENPFGDGKWTAASYTRDTVDLHYSRCSLEPVLR